MYKDMMDTIGMVNAADPELGAAMERELTRQRENIELIASENIVSPAVMAALLWIRMIECCRSFWKSCILLRWRRIQISQCAEHTKSVLQGIILKIKMAMDMIQTKPFTMRCCRSRK